MNLDFGSSLYALHSSKMIVELESECFYVLEIPLGTDHVIFGSGSVTAGRWEPVVKDNDSCHDVYRDLLSVKAHENSFAEEISSEYHVGTIQWLKASYPFSGTAVARVIDPDMNLNPEKIDNLDIFVWSDSHTKGVTQTATETGVSTGVFESTVFLSLTFDACCNRLKVTDGDTLTAEYIDSTLPASYTADALSIFTKSEIRPTLESPLKQFKSGVPIDEIQCNDSMVLMSKDEKHPACVTQLTAKKLSDRGWFWVLDVVPWNDAANKPDNHKINCDNQTDPYQEFQCFKDAHSNCRIATVNPEIYTIEGDPIYTTLAITSDCKIRGIADMSTDRFWGEPEIIITTCNTIERDEYSWSADNCDAKKLSEMQFNFMMQIYPQILECEENGNTWNREKLECVKENEN